MNILSPFTREFWIDDRLVRQAVGRLPERDAVKQAHLSAVALENDRNAMLWQRREAWNDYLRALSERTAASGRVNAAHERFRELDDQLKGCSRG